MLSMIKTNLKVSWLRLIDIEIVKIITVLIVGVLISIPIKVFADWDPQNFNDDLQKIKDFNEVNKTLPPPITTKQDINPYVNGKASWSALPETNVPKPNKIDMGGYTPVLPSKVPSSMPTEKSMYGWDAQDRLAVKEFQSSHPFKMAPDGTRDYNSPKSKVIKPDHMFKASPGGTRDYSSPNKAFIYVEQTREKASVNQFLDSKEGPVGKEKTKFAGEVNDYKTNVLNGADDRFKADFNKQFGVSFDAIEKERTQGSFQKAIYQYDNLQNDVAKFKIEDANRRAAEEKAAREQAAREQAAREQAARDKAAQEAAALKARSTVSEPRPDAYGIKPIKITSGNTKITPIDTNKYRDVTGNGLFTKKDVNAIANYYVGNKDKNFIANSADYNNDGKIDIVDALAGAQKLANSTISEPRPAVYDVDFTATKNLKPEKITIAPVANDGKYTPGGKSIVPASAVVNDLPFDIYGKGPNSGGPASKTTVDNAKGPYVGRYDNDSRLKSKSTTNTAVDNHYSPK